jgi:hypothetical protein
MKKPPEEIEYFLSRGALGGPERERILGRALATLPVPVPWWRRRVSWMAASGLVAAAAVALLVALPRNDGWSARGGGAASVRLDLACLGGRLESCPAGSTLAFAALDPSAAGYLAAYAEPRGGGERIWYLSADTGAPVVAPAAGVRPAEYGVRLGPEHASGPYQVHVFLTRQPASKANLRAGRPADTLAEATFDLVVVPR